MLDIASTAHASDPQIEEHRDVTQLDKSPSQTPGPRYGNCPQLLSMEEVFPDH